MRVAGVPLALAFLMVLLGPSDRAHAQEKGLEDLLEMGLETLMDLEVVTASRKPQAISEAPANIVVLTREVIARRGYRTLEEALRDVPGFDFTTSQPAGEYPTHLVFRGITDVGQSKTLIMVDGIVRNDVSNGWFRNVGFDFTLSDVERIEIVSGPGSALYGANAYAGLVHVITSSEGESRRRLEVTARGTAGAHRTIVPEIVLRGDSGDGLRFQLAGRWYRTDGDGGAGRPDPGSYYHGNYEPDFVLTTEHGNMPNERNPDGSRKPLADGFRTDIDDVCLRGRVQKGHLSLGFTYWDRDEGLGSEVVGYEYFANTAGLDYRAHHAGYTVFAAYDHDLAQGVVTRSRMYFRSTRILPETGFVYTYKYQSVNNGTDPPVVDKLKGYHGEGYIAGLEQQVDLDVSSEGSLVAGIQLEQKIKQYAGISLGARQGAESSIVSSTYTSEEKSVQPVYFSRSAAAFVQGEHHLKGDYYFTGGLRFDADDEYGHVLNPRLALVKSPARGFGLKLLYGQAFKAPTVFELFDEFRGNEQLAPEKVGTVEVELSYRFTRAAQLRASYFYSRLTDIIVVAPNPDPARVPIGPNSEHLDYYQNIGSTNTSGFAAIGEFQIAENLYAYANYVCTLGDSGDEIDNISRHKANLGINYLLGGKLNINLRANIRGRVKAPASNVYFHPKSDATIAQTGYDYVTEDDPDGYMDGHALLNLTLTGQRLFGDSSNLVPQVIVTNLFNTRHMGIGRQSGSGARPIDELQPVVQNPSGFIPAYHPQPGREIYAGLQYRFRL